VGQRVRGEGVLPGDDEPAHQPGGDRDHGAAEEGVLHEAGLQHLQPVALELDGGEHVGGGGHAGSFSRRG
jgi:hypothetical protein